MGRRQQTLFATGLLVAAALLAFLAYGVRTGGAVVDWDAQAEAWLGGVDPAMRVRIGDALSLPGARIVGAAVAVASALALWAWGERRLSILAAGTALLGEAAVYALKEAFHRARPTAGLPEPSFPSGHASRAMLCYGLAATLVAGQWRALHPQAARWIPLMLAAWAALVLLVDAGRVVGGYHWASDVVAGNAVGALLLGSAVAVAPRLRRAGAPSAP